MVTNVFKATQRVHFEHCDPAGLIFYPRYFQLSHQVIELFFLEGLGVSHADLVVEQRIGIPTVKLEAGFHAASRLEDVLDFSVVVTKIGRSSVTLNIEAHCEGELRCQITQVIVFAQLESNPIQSMPIPETVRAQLTNFLVKKDA